MPNDCIFCKIIAGEIPAKRIYEDPHVIAIVDAHPQAPEHILVLPREHYAGIAEFSDGAEHSVIAQLMAVAAKLGNERGPKGFRLVINSGDEGGQTVGHLHVHVLAGRRMTWPPG